MYVPTFGLLEWKRDADIRDIIAAFATELASLIRLDLLVNAKRLSNVTSN
jgi:hypothetical protein